MRPDLDAREWTVPLNKSELYTKKPGVGRLWAASETALVSEGYVLAKELGIKGSQRPIPPGECAITSLAAETHAVYGATSGRRAYVFVYWTQPAYEAVQPLARLENHTAIRHALVPWPGKSVFAGTSSPGRQDYPGGEILQIERGGLGDVIQEWGGEWSPVKSLGIPVPGEGVACMVSDLRRNMLVGLSDRTGTLFTADVQSGSIATHGLIDGLQRFSPELIVGPDGFVYGCGTAGRILRFDPEKKAIEDTGMTLPSLAGRGQYSKIGAWALDEESGLIYAGDVADGLLSVIGVCEGKTRVLGKPTAQPHVRAITVAADGCVYGVAGMPDTMCHLFCYNPCSGEMRDLGVMTTGTERRWYGYEFDCAAAGPDGRIYFGESDYVSHLFVYFPPYPRRAMEKT